MNKAEIIKGLTMTIDGLTTIKNALSSGGEDTAPETTTEKTNAPAPAASGDKPTRAQLDKMGYNEFKTLAAKAGVKCTGTRDAIMSRLEQIGYFTEGDDADENDTADETPAPKTKGKKSAETAEDAPAPKSDKPVGGKRGLTKKTAEPAADEYDEQAKAIMEDTPVEDIISALAEVGVKATEKNVLPKLADALRRGLIEADEEDESEDEAEAAANTAADTEDDEGEDDTNYTAEFDPEGFNDPANMSEARREACATLADEILTDYSEGKLTVKKITAFLENTCTQDELDLIEDEEDEDALVNLYVEMKKRFVDDEGETHDPEEPYELGGADFCCGHPLKFNKKTKKHICETCGGEYEEA